MAYGARLESVLGESPQGFESPILRVTQLLSSSAQDSPPGFLITEALRHGADKGSGSQKL